MTTTCPQSALPSRPFGSSELKAALLEPFLILGVSAFWIVTLPFAAVALLCVKTWDALSAVTSADPLILRRGPAVSGESEQMQHATPKRA